MFPAKKWDPAPLLRSLPVAAWIRKKASISLRIAKPKLAALAALKPPKAGAVAPKLSCVMEKSKSAVGVPSASRPIETLGPEAVGRDVGQVVGDQLQAA